MEQSVPSVIMLIVIFIVFVSPVAVIYFAIKIIRLKNDYKEANEEYRNALSRQLDKSIIGFVIATIILAIPVVILAIMSTMHSS